uniref:Uncharacterized protein n=1 Tax=Rhizophora mucronata TaxID=61149 RepID=A0A2P2Q9V4_RHIMU
MYSKPGSGEQKKEKNKIRRKHKIKTNSNALTSMHQKQIRRK